MFQILFFFVSNSVDNLIKNSENIDKKIYRKSVGIFENRAKMKNI